jgi:hypothetical protein
MSLGVLVGVLDVKSKRDFSLRRPTRSQEANVKGKASASFARNDGWWFLHDEVLEAVGGTGDF